MPILNKYKHWNFKLKPMLNNYWDFVLSKNNSITNENIHSEDDCLSAYINFGDESCYNGNFVHSYEKYKWEGAINKADTFKYYDESGNTHYTKNKDEVPIGIPVEKIILLENIGYTGIDNGLIDYGGWDKISNKEFFNIFTNSIFEIPESGNNLWLHSITGNTGLHDFDLSIEDDYVKLNGGFYQGFFKLSNCKYQVLPSTIENEWNIEIMLRPTYYIIGEKSLDNLYPQNAGIFFYIGTRAEDKFIQLYNCDLSKYKTRVQPDRILCENFADGYFAPDDNGKEYYGEVNYRSFEKDENCTDCIAENNSNNKAFNKNKAKILYHFLYEYGFKNYEVDSCYCTNTIKTYNSNDGYFADDYKLNRYFSKYINDCSEYEEKDIIISGETLYTSEGEPLADSGYYEIKTDNKFLYFNRTKYGFNTANWDEDTVIILTGSTNNIHSDNLYLLMNRTKNGYTTQTIDAYYSENKSEYNFISDIQNNAFCLKYNSDGSISYRYLVKSCNNEDRLEVLSETSLPNLIKEDEWNIINAKFSKISEDKMKISIYINGYLKFISKEIPLFNFHNLKCSDEKQEGVPFNISIGGGTQGLCDSQWLNYEKSFEKILPIEENFAGTFIGDIKYFKFYTSLLEYSQIKNNYFNIIKNKKVFI